ncbi:hypothetical protein [Micromonospora sp. L32]
MEQDANRHETRAQAVIRTADVEPENGTAVVLIQLAEQTLPA